MYRTILVSLSIWLLILSVSSNDSPPTIRQTANGPVQGLERISSLGQKYYSFRGIPFAEAPITGTDPYTGEHVDRRFKAPEPLKRRWPDPLKAHAFGRMCSQPQTTVDFYKVDTSNMGEDCLYLNIYVPAGGSENKTVLVYIYGGGFINGDATDDVYGPDFLLSQDNVVVTINYRLGIFGFLNLNFGEYTGNMGLKDQQLALKWVHENIEHFSGNKNEVLIFGESAGAASVHLQMLNKESRSYFNRAFVASGSALHSYVLTKADHKQRLRACLNIDGTNKLIKHLKSEHSDILMSCPHYEIAGEFNSIWAPVVESKSTKHAFLTKTPEEIYNGPIEEAPVMDAMFSFTAQEMFLSEFNLSTSEISEPLIKENVMETTKFTLPFKGFTKTAHPKEYAKALNKLRTAYFSNVTNIDAIKRTNTDLLSDSFVNYKKIKATAFQANANQKASSEMERKNTFLFRFNVTADLNLVRIVYNQNLTDAAHTDELCYIFHCHYFDKTQKYDKHLEEKNLNYDLIMRSVKMITNFARTGDPSIEGDTPFRSINSIDEIFCQEVANELKTTATHDIRQQKYYDIWHEIDEVYKNLDV